MIGYLLYMFNDDRKTYGIGAAFFNLRFMLAFDIARFLIRGNIRLQVK